MRTHTIRPSQGQVGFIIDDEFFIKFRCHQIHLICLNKGPKKPEEYKNYMIPVRNFKRYSYKMLSENIMCNEHIYIDIVSEYHEIYMRGFVTNILESDLNIIPIDLHIDNRITRIEQNTENINEYMESIFGECYRDMFRDKFYKTYGVKLFEKNIRLNSYNSTFTIDLSNVPLKDEFDQLIKANVDKIKRILFPNEIPNDRNYSIY